MITPDKTLTHAERLIYITAAEGYLNAALPLLVKAGATKTADKTRAALRSCAGAYRNRDRFAQQEARQ